MPGNQPAIRTNVDIRHLNSLGLPCRAAGWCRVHHWSALQQALADPRFAQQPHLILGGGSNVVLVDDFPGLVIQPDWHGIDIVAETSRTVSIQVGAAEPWDRLVRWSVDRQLHGLENLAAIPGWCGAAPMQNIGAYGVEFSDSCVAVDYLDLSTGQSHQLSAEQCQFGYRHSIFKTTAAHNWLVTGVSLQLARQAPFKLTYPGVREALDAQGISEPTPAAVAAAITRIRQRKLPDPASLGNAGSFFKNPIVSRATADALLEQHPQLPHWPAGEQVKLSAAWLIEQCGWKGRRTGPVGVHRQHALVLVHYGHGNGRQLLHLAGNIQQDVNNRFGIALQPEPKIIQSS